MTALTRFLRKRKEKQALNPTQQSNLYQAINNIAVFGSFSAIAVFILGLFKIINMSSFVFGLTSTVALVSIGCLMLLPWLRNYENNIHKKLSIIFISFVVACTILWLICVYLGIGLYNKSKIDTVSKTSLINTLNFIKITLIISIQFLLISLVTNTIIKYKKQLIVLQIVSYISNLFFDFYVTCFLLCIKLSTANGLEISKTISFLFSKIMFVLFLISIIYMLLSSKIMKTVESKRVNFVMDSNYNLDGSQKINQDQSPTIQSPTERLENLQSMLDKNLITKDEYDEKRNEILKDL